MPEPLPRIDDLRRRVLQDPASLAFAQLAEEYRRAGAYESAVEVCRAGLARHPGYLSARVTLGRALLELDQVDAAHDELQAVLAGSPNNQPALRGLGEVCHRRGNLGEALRYYRKALGLARHDPDLQQLVAELTRVVSRAPARSASPSPASPPKPDAAGLLTLEQLTQELQATLQAPVVRPKAPTDKPTGGTVATFQSPGTRPPANPEGGPQNADDRRTLARLEGWLTAIHGFRTERCA